MTLLLLHCDITCKNSHTHTHTHTHTHPHTPACNRLQTRTIGMHPPTEDTRFLTHHYSMWLFITQPRTSPYTPNQGHGLNSIFTSFSSSCSSRKPRTVHGVKCVLGLLWNFMCVSLFGGWRCLHTHTHTQHIPQHTPTKAGTMLLSLRNLHSFSTLLYSLFFHAWFHNSFKSALL